MKKLLILSAAVLMYACAQDTRGYIVAVGDAAPDFTIEYLDGSTQQLSDLRGQVVMVQFTASWCSVCRKEMPHIESDIWQKYRRHPGFALVGVDYKESPEVTQQFADDIGVTYPLTLDESGAKFHLYADREAGVTRNIIIDREGAIVFLTRLYDEAEFAAMKTVIDELLNRSTQGG